jgi:colicin import membrane protein
MAEQKESSVLFSLKELMNLEEDRIKQEEEEKKRRAEAEIQARADAERRAREQEQARLQAEEDRRRNEELRKKEEAARIDAIRHGEIEKARIEAEQRAKMEALTKQQEHERHLTSLQHDDHKKKLQRMVTFSIAGAAIFIIGGLGIYLGKIKPDQEARERATQAALQAQQEEARRMQIELEKQTQKVNDLMAQLSQATSDAQRAEIKRQIEAEQRKAQAIRASTAARPSSGGGDAPAKPKPPCNCQPGDPLCSCL